jgi:hypothetical protein
MTTETSTLEITPDQNKHWLKRMGWAGFSFFFIKGMLWLIVPLLAHSALFT